MFRAYIDVSLSLFFPLSKNQYKKFKNKTKKLMIWSKMSTVLKLRNPSVGGMASLLSDYEPHMSIAKGLLSLLCVVGFSRQESPSPPSGRYKLDA